MGTSSSSKPRCQAPRFGQEVGLAIQKDLAAGRALQIRGTPTFVVGGETYPGRIPPEVLAPAPAPATGPPPRYGT